MQKIIKYFLLIFILLNFKVLANENFFNSGLKLFKEKKYEDARFMFERSIVFNPKDSKSYLYLAKIFKKEENEFEEEKNINATLLLESDNEEAMYMLIDIKLEKSDIKKVEDLKEKFKIICDTLCSKIDSIDERLSNINVENES